MGHPVHRISSVARPVEPQYRTNLAIMIAMGAVLAIAGAVALYRGSGLLDAGRVGGTAAAAVFVTWALTRELAPDDNPAAFVALAPLFALVWLEVDPALLGPLTAMGLVRVVNRSVGPPARLTDRLAVLAMALVVVREPWDLAVGLAAVLAFGLDASLSAPQRTSAAFAGLTVVGLGARLALEPPAGVLVSPGPWTAGALAVTVGMIIVILRQRPPSAPSDIESYGPLRTDRVRGGMVVGLVATTGSLVGGDAAVLTWGVAWAAALGVVLGRPFVPRSPAP